MFLKASFSIVRLFLTYAKKRCIKKIVTLFAQKDYGVSKPKTEFTMLKSFTFAALLLFTLASCDTSKLSSSQKGKASYLFVIMSNYGKIQQISDGTYQLILDHGDVEKVLAFSNRPYRLEQHLTGESLKTMWSQGSNSFAEDPPNATVIINQQLQTIILLNMNVVGDQTVFTIRADGPQSLIEITGPTQLLVDGDLIQLGSGEASADDDGMSPD